MVERWDRIEAAGGAVVVVHDDPEDVRSGLLHDLEPPFPVLVDGDRRAYEAWGLRRLAWWRIFGDPRVWWQYLKFALRGERFLPWGSDILQMGGDFVVDTAGSVTYARPQRSDTRPPVGELVEALEAAG